MSQTRAVKALLAEHQPLLVLDGEIAAGDAWRNLSRAAPALLHLIATSTAPLAQGDWRNQPIGNLAESDALRLFRQKAGLKDTANPTADILALAAQLKYAAFPLTLAARSMVIARQSPAEFSETVADALDPAMTMTPPCRRAEYQL